MLPLLPLGSTDLFCSDFFLFKIEKKSFLLILEVTWVARVTSLSDNDLLLPNLGSTHYPKDIIYIF
jgi:hypothetical protein